MCIALFTTAHPGYALILINNRDEYILRPTSRPSWWRHPASGESVLSSRDLLRAERGTWLGITRSGVLAVLTNYRELDAHDAAHPVHGVKSRGRVVTGWLGGAGDGGVDEGVRRLVGTGLAGVGGFSLVGGRLRRRDCGVAVVSNRARRADDVPLLGRCRGETWALSNTVFDDPDPWPKVRDGTRLLRDLVAAAAARDAPEPDLVRSLFALLDTESLPEGAAAAGLDECLALLKHTIFVPPIGDEPHRQAMRDAMARGRQKSGVRDGEETDGKADGQETDGRDVNGNGSPATAPVFETGMYGTQRQTVLLVDWHGNVTFIERALWDSNGHVIPRGDGDVVFRFHIDEWDD